MGSSGENKENIESPGHQLDTISGSRRKWQSVWGGCGKRFSPQQGEDSSESWSFGKVFGMGHFSPVLPADLWECSAQPWYQPSYLSQWPQYGWGEAAWEWAWPKSNSSFGTLSEARHRARSTSGALGKRLEVQGMGKVSKNPKKPAASKGGVPTPCVWHQPRGQGTPC